MKRKILFCAAGLFILALTAAIFIRLNIIGQASYIFLYLFADALAFIFGTEAFLHGFESARKKYLTAQTAAMLLMMIPVLISFQNISASITKQLGPVHWSEKFTASIQPSMRSVLFGILLIASVIVRNRGIKFSNARSYIVLALDIMFVSSFLNILCNNSPWPIPFITIDDQTFLILAAIVSWVGISAVSGLMWIALFILGISRMIKIEVAMGFTAVIYLISAFLSLLLQANYSKLSLSFKEGFFTKAAEKVKGDINATGDLIKKI